MRRWTLRILVCLLLGMVTTVAVAWGLAITAPPLPVYSSSGPGSVSLFGVSVDLRRTDEVRDVIAVHEAGIPLRALARHFRSSIPAGVTVNEAGVTVAGPGSATIRASRLEVTAAFRTPDAVVLPGFLIDTLFYAAIWGGLFFGYVGAKQAIRRKRGRCPRCGYDLRGALVNGCSECGWNRQEKVA